MTSKIRLVQRSWCLVVDGVKTPHFIQKGDDSLFGGVPIFINSKRTFRYLLSLWIWLEFYTWFGRWTFVRCVIFIDFLIFFNLFNIIFLFQISFSSFNFWFKIGNMVLNWLFFYCYLPCLISRLVGRLAFIRFSSWRVEFSLCKL